MKSDLELLGDFRNGDSAAFEKLVRRHHLNLYNFFFFLVRRGAVAESLTREAFVRIHAERRAISFNLGFALGMLRVAAACWREYAGRTSANVTARSDLELNAGAVSEAEFDREIARGFEHLPADGKLMLAMCEIGGLSYGEIARVLDIHPGTVKARISHAYAALRFEARQMRGANSLATEFTENTE